MRRAALPLLAGLLAGLLTGCSQGGNESTLTISGTAPPDVLPTSGSATATAAPETTPPETAPADPEPTSLPPSPRGPRVIDTIATDLRAPWGLAFFANGDALVTERDTRRVLRISGPNHVVAEVGTIDIAAPQGEAGLLGVAISPDFADDRLVYFYVSTPEDNRIVRTTLDDGTLGELDPIFTGIPNGFIHDGGRLAFGPDGFLYASTGETGEPSLAQDRESLGGKILRLTPDGDPAPGNAFDTAIWSWGHRNVQGLAFAGRRLWASEFGQDAFDELNLIRSGRNYGWPSVEGTGGEPEFVDPLETWATSEASPSGLAYARGYLYMAALQGERLWRVQVRGSRVLRTQDFFVGEYGRMRTIEVAPDGTLWLMTSNLDGRGVPTDGKDDRILQLRP